MRVYEERQKSLKLRMEKLQREMHQPEAQEEEKKMPQNGGNHNRNNQPGANPPQNRFANQQQNNVQQVIQGVEVVGAELNPHHLASQKETAK